MSEAASVQILPVVTPAELDRFILLPNAVNAGDPNYVPPLIMDRREAFQAKSNPFFAHAEVAFWLAVKGGRDVGRISAQIDRLAPEKGVGHFGLISAFDDRAVFAALFRTAETWLAERGCAKAVGPLNLSINEEVGLLVEGRDTPPMVMMGHDPAHVGPAIEAQGYAKAMDVFAYVAETTKDLPPTVKRRVDRGPPEGVVLRQLDFSRYEEEVRTLTEILNDAWAENWGFTPTTEAETAQLAKAMRPVIDKRLAWFAEVDGESAGFLICLPNVNEAIRDLNGRLFPFGWAKLIWRLKVGRMKTGRVPLMGVRKKFGRDPRGLLLPFLLMDAGAKQARKLGYERIEFSWILENNGPMNHISNAVGARVYKTYRLYEKALSG